MSPHPPFTLIGLPYQFGRRADPDGGGYQMARGPEVLLAPDAAPAAFRAAFDNVDLRFLDDLDDARPAAPGDRPMSPGDQMVRQLVQNNGLASAVREEVARGRFPVVAAGGCNSSIGVVGGLDDPGLGLIWFDAHHDAETPDTSSDGLFEGMPVAIIAGRCWPRWRARIQGFHVIPEERIMQVGLHDLSFEDDPEAPRGGVGTLVGPEEVAASSFEEAFSAGLDSLAAHVSRVYVHIDTDVIDAAIMRGNLHAAHGGPSPAQLVWAVERIAERLEVRALSFSSFDTNVDPVAPGILVPLMRDVAAAATTRAEAVAR
jgi:arginase